MLQDMRESKLCPQTLSPWSEYIMLQSLLLLFKHECSFNIAFIASRTFQVKRRKSKVDALLSNTAQLKAR